MARSSISAFTMYRYDASYAMEVQQAHPGRFALVKPVNPDDPAVGDVIAEWKKVPAAVGIRVMMQKSAKHRAGRRGAGSCDARGRASRYAGQSDDLGQSG